MKNTVKPMGMSQFGMDKQDSTQIARKQVCFQAKAVSFLVITVQLTKNYIGLIY